MSLADMNVGRRLTLGFGAALVLVAVAAVMTMIRLAETRDLVADTTKYYAILAAAQALGEDAAAGAALMDEMILTNDDAGASKIEAQAGAARPRDDQAMAKLVELVKSEEGRKQLAALGHGRDAYAAAFGETLQYLRNGQSYQARQSFDGKVAPLGKAFHADLAAFAGTQMQHAQVKLKTSASALGFSIWILAAGLLVAVAATLLIGRWTRRNVTLPLARATEVSEAVAAGRLDQTVEPHGCYEARHLLAACRTMQTTLREFVRQQQQVARQHAEGYVSRTIQAERFKGVFAEVAQAVNGLMAAQLATTMRLVEVAGCYAVGDLSADMDRLPNEKALITETMDRAKASLSAMSAEIMSLVDSARRGELDQRGNAQRFQHDFRHMIEGVNQTLDAVVAPIGEVSALLAALAGGDLSRVIETEHQGAFGRLKDDANATVAGLRRLTGQIREVSESIDTASREIATGNGDLAARTEQQAASLEQTAASMEELTTTVKQNAENARRASQVASGSLDTARRGGESVQEVVSTMQAIHESSGKVVEIISLIDGIAFQTNILALNAAVEAARAGQQGRGFAVVASEVRTLAQRSAAAAREIRSLITASTERTGYGMALVQEAGKTMAEVVAGAQTVAELMSEITAASREQSSGIQQINQAVSHMDQATQQNAALVEQVAASAKSLQDQAAGLVTAARQFKL
ncbi:MAG: methyl-accepting chemotaxis protein [Nevskia sp.]|nr:methyl-accepting chemotaxis protein [Nevskia sp.]